MRIDNPSISGSLSFIGGNNSISATSVNLTGSFSGSVVGTFEGGFSSTATAEISGAFDSVSSSLASRIASQENFSSSLDNTFATDADLNLVSSSVDSLNAATSSYLQNTTDTLTGDLTVTGTLTAQDLHVQEITSSIVYSSGSNIFGENVSDTQKFTGSLQVSGSTNYLLGDVGIGTISPSVPSGGGLTIYNSTIPRINFKNSTTGDTSTDGLEIYINGLNALINNRETGELALATSNSTRMTIDSSGTTTFTGAVYASNYNVTNTSGYLVRENTDSGYGLYKNTTTDLGLAVNGNLAFNIDSAQNATFAGTLSANKRAVITTDGTYAYGLNINSSDQSHSRIRITNTGTGGETYSIMVGTHGVSNAGFAIRNETDSTTPLQFDTSDNATFAGNVGIGGTPAVNFEVNKSGARLKLTDGTNQINMGLWDGANYRFEGDANRPLYFTSYQGNINLGISGGTTMTIQSGGVGIGTTSPQTHLDVVSSGHTKLRVRTTGTADASMEVLGYDAGVHIGDATNGNRWAIWNDGPSTSSSLKFGSYALGTWYAAASQVMTMTSDGNVGIRCNPSANPAKLNVRTAGSSQVETALRLINPYGFGSAGTGVKIAFAQDRSDAENFEMAAIETKQSIAGTSDNGDLTFFTRNGGSLGERMRILSSGGITFNGDTASANALDDYEEGTWTPVIRGANTAGTYEILTNYTKYIKIGSLCYLTGWIRLASSVTGGGVGYVQITGLPFSKITDSEAVGAVILNYVDFVADYVCIEFTSTGPSNVLYLRAVVDNANGNDVQISGIGANSIINFSISYYV